MVLNSLFCADVPLSNYSLTPGIFKATQPSHPSVGMCFEYWRWFQPPLGKKWWVLHSSSPCDQECWHISLYRLKALAVNLSLLSGRRGLYANLIGSDWC